MSKVCLVSHLQASSIASTSSFTKVRRVVPSAGMHLFGTHLSKSAVVIDLSVALSG